MQLSSAQRIGIFGLSANPPTFEGGHASVVQYFVNAGIFDEIWVVPVYRHSYSSKRTQEPFADRVEMCRLNFLCLSTASCPVRVMDIEKNVNDDLMKESCDLGSANSNTRHVRMGTIDVLRWVRMRIPRQAQLALVLGGDTFRDLSSGLWKMSEEILSSTEIHVVHRAGVSTADIPLESRPDISVKCHAVEGTRELSSSLVRAQTMPSMYFCGQRVGLLTKSDRILQSSLHPDVLQYIRDRGLYMFSRAAVGRRNRSRLWITLQLGAMVGLIISDFFWPEWMKRSLVNL